MKNKNSKKLILKGIIFTTTILLLISLGMLARSFYKSRQEDNLFSELEKKIENQEGVKGWKQEQHKNPYQKLASENPHLYGWIKIEDTKLNYPVMYTPKEPEYYLRKNFEQEYSISGVPFIGENYAEEGKNTIIYGHNMLNGTMFSVLSEYKDKEYWKKHPFIQYDTLDKKGKYEVFAVFNIDVEEAQKNFRYHEYTDLRGASRFMEFIDFARERSFYETGLEVKPEDELLTLSTCSYDALDGRSVVVAKKIE